MLANTSETSPTINAEPADWLIQLNQIIRQHIEKEELSNAFLAQKMNVSESHFYRLVKAKTGKSPNLYVRELKLNFAKALIESKEYSLVSDLAYRVGFKRVDYFSKLFLQQFGKRPKDLMFTPNP